jgi:hypothetical protein
VKVVFHTPLVVENLNLMEDVDSFLQVERHTDAMYLLKTELQRICEVQVHQ